LKRGRRYEKKKTKKREKRRGLPSSRENWITQLKHQKNKKKTQYTVAPTRRKGGENGG